MKNDVSSNTPSSTRISWIMMVLALASLTFLALYIPPDRRANVRLLRDLKVQVPMLTRWMLAIPDIAFPVAATVVGIADILIQWRGRGSIGCAGFHMFLIVACAIFFVAYRESLFQPIADLIRQVSGPLTGG